MAWPPPTIRSEALFAAWPGRQRFTPTLAGWQYDADRIQSAAVLGQFAYQHGDLTAPPGGEVLIPPRGRWCLSRAMPVVYQLVLPVAC